MGQEICFTCLSTYRNLTPFSAIKGITSQLKAILAVNSTSLICWECRAVMQRMQTFIDQASRAQDLLKHCVENQKSPETLQSLSKLSVSLKTNCDENLVYCLKCEIVANEEICDIRSETKYDEEEEEIIPKTEKTDDEFQDNFDLPEIENVSVEPCHMSPEESDDEKPLILRVRKKKVKHKSGGDKKTTIPKKHKVGKWENAIEAYATKTSKEEEKFIIKRMALEEVYRLREGDRKSSRYLSCPFKCETCITGYFHEDKYKAHIETRHSEEIGPHKCDICARRFKVAPALAHHRDVHFRSYQCRECDVTSHRLSAMLIHSSGHDLRKFSCKECGASFLKERQLRYHREKAHKERPACGACGKRFANVSVLRKHAHIVHSNAPKQTCTQCGRAVRNLRAHLATHAPPASDAFCVECGKSFRNWQSYRRHLRLHRRHRSEEDMLKYECNACSLRFSCKTGLQRHIAARHTKQYPFTCDLCSKGFSRRDRLKYHILERHEGGQRPRREVCPYCGKAFKTKQVLTHHIRTHTGEKPHQCQHCPWSFAQHSTLKTHMRALHGNTDAAGNTGGDGNTGGGGKTDKTEIQRLRSEIV